MKVYEKINELKGTNATSEQMFNWAAANKIPLCCFEDELELGEGVKFDERLNSIIDKLLSSMETEYDRVKNFLESEY